MKQEATWTKVGERIGKICVGHSEHIGLAGVSIIEGSLGKGSGLVPGGAFLPRGSNILQTLFQDTIFSLLLMPQDPSWSPGIQSVLLTSSEVIFKINTELTVLKPFPSFPLLLEERQDL